MDRGLVLNIQRYCIHDGPGIRTTVFLKGCPLGCWWCHNPESQPLEPQVQVVQSRCLRCGECVEACPEKAALVGDATASCSRCGACVEACPTGARQMVGRSMTTEQVLEEILRDRIFYGDSGGGATFSGGEPLSQPEFVIQLLQACRDAAIHTTLDTCGFAPRDVVLAAAPLVDLFLYDLKVLDEELHRRHTGISNTIILENLTLLGAIHDNIWIRVPVIPGFNDTELQMDATARFVAAIPGVRQVNLLPYHALGSHKAVGGNGREAATLADPIRLEQLEQAANTFRAAGLSTLIGG